MGVFLRVIVLGLVGALLGAIVGGATGIGLGFAWTNVFHTSNFEGYAGMLVFFTFMPLGCLVGALAGGIGLGRIGLRDGS